MGKIKNCEWCDKLFEDKHRDGKRFCTRSCAAFYRAKVYPNPMAGQSGDKNPNWKGVVKKKCLFCEQVLGVKAYSGGMYCNRKCYANHKSQLSKVDMQCNTCGKMFSVLKHDVDKKKYCSTDCYRNSPDFSSLQSIRGKGKTIPEWHRQAVSKATAARSPEKEFSYGKSGHHISVKAGSVFYRSSYEKKAYQILDADDKAISYQPEPFTIMYVNSDGNTRRYRPDILVKKSRGKPVLIEVKPEWKMKDEKTILKIEAGKKYAAAQGWRFEVWTEKKLGLAR